MLKKSLISLMITGAFAAHAEAKDIRLVFEYNNGNKQALMNEVKNAGGNIKVELDQDNAFAAVVSYEGFAQIKNSKVVKSIEIDAPRKAVPLDVKYSGFSDYTPYGLPMVQADQLEFMGGKKVCIMDTGYYLGHPDLPQGDVDGTDEGAGSWYQDGNGHGTHVAGTIAAVDGNGGVAGVLGSNEASLYIVRVFNDEGGWSYASDIAGAAYACADGGADVINMSLGSAFETKVEQRAFDRIERMGILSIAAAGNDEAATHNYPASYDSVMSVAAVDDAEEWAYFSQRTAKVELAAPGVDVASTYIKVGIYDEDENLIGEEAGPGHVFMSGTSMASPHVAGVAALVWSHFPQCNNFEIRNALTASAKDLGEPGRDYKYGYGLVQAKAAYDYLMTNTCNGKGVK
ncbi:S8 family peptidase [Shewanella sp. Isolate11]|uniref:S8 family peptidase n=1 Tax=Shewanella sp. Isolate11 TaxID=2908530 RepID=UPI001EFC47A1|nr:S8 family peptidase [Shewanella sp. Isolate11]MCG9695883.1 S8 family peptidase [Shewanella sp. Isolate11]